MKLMLDDFNKQKWYRNTLIFLAPLGLIYFGSVAVGLENGRLFEAFIPSSVVIGAMMLYVVNSVTDYLRKIKRSKK